MVEIVLAFLLVVIWFSCGFFILKMIDYESPATLTTYLEKLAVRSTPFRCVIFIGGILSLIAFASIVVFYAVLILTKFAIGFRFKRLVEFLKAK